MSLEYDAESGVLHVRTRESEVEETLASAEPGFGAHPDVDREGDVLGVEFLSFEEFVGLVSRRGTLEVTGQVEEPAHLAPPRLA